MRIATALIRVAIISLSVILTGCETVYNSVMPEGMTLIEHHYDDWAELSEHCDGGEGCAIVNVMDWTCTIHLPVAWNGDPMHRDHEIRHCSGQLDAPKSVKRYFPPTAADRSPGP